MEGFQRGCSGRDSLANNERRGDFDQYTADCASGDVRDSCSNQCISSYKMYDGENAEGVESAIYDLRIFGEHREFCWCDSADNCNNYGLKPIQGTERPSSTLRVNLTILGLRIMINYAVINGFKACLI